MKKERPCQNNSLYSVYEYGVVGGILTSMLYFITKVRCHVL